MFAIVGIGNVGSEYENTYHNLGFMVLDAFAKKHNLTFSKKKCNAYFCETVLFGKKVMLFKPTTYVNNSGICVSELKRKFKLNNNQILVVVDDVNIKVGDYRIRQSGSAGGHNGLKSIISQIGEDFPRLRVGIGSEFNSLVNYVLSKISKEHMTVLESVINVCVILLEKFIMENGEINRVKI